VRVWCFVGEILISRVGITKDLCYYSEHGGMEQILEQTKNRKCSDPKDRIFALLSLTQEGYGIEPDYTKSLQDVYTDALKCIIASSDHLGVFVTLEIHGSSEWTPTWVPDWSRPKRSTILPWFYASLKQRQTFEMFQVKYS
jgi:hypothetical protein